MITLVMLTCKRLDSFIKTMDTLKSMCPTKFAEYIIIDDNSSQSDRKVMKEKYPFITLVEKGLDEKGQVKSLNKIFELVKTPYVFYLEDDWTLQEELDLTDWLHVFEDKSIKQLCFSLPWQSPKKGHNIYKYNKDLEQPHQKEYRDKIYPSLHAPIQKEGHGWPGFTLRPALWDVKWLRETVGTFNEFLAPTFHDYDYAIRYAITGKRIAATPNFFEHDETNIAAFCLNDERRLWDPKVTLPTLVVGSFVDIDRVDIDGRAENHYWDSLSKILTLPNPLVVVTEAKHIDNIKAMRGMLPLQLITIDKEFLDNIPQFDKIQQIKNTEEYRNQAEWLKESVVSKSSYYIPLTLIKQSLLEGVATENPFGSDTFYWLDAGIMSSYNINKLELPPNYSEDLTMYTYPYLAIEEVHGFAAKGMVEFANTQTEYVCRACYFGGSSKSIQRVSIKFNKLLDEVLDAGYIGTEEALYTILSYKYPELFNLKHMADGDIGQLIGEN